MGMGNYSVRSERYRFNPSSKEPYRISRSRIDLFLECGRCFWLSERYGIGRPSMPPFSLNNAVDELLKREFDVHRVEKTTHPLLKTYGLDALPFQHPDLEAWRDALRRGIMHHHKETNLMVRGGIDDVWQSPSGELILVDYKATSKKTEINLDADWQIGYKRQIEVYQWLFRQNGFPVSDTGYFVYVNGNSDAEAFDAKLEFELHLLPYTGNTAWIEPTLHNIRSCLTSDVIPPIGASCEHCPYREAAGRVLFTMRPKKESGEKEVVIEKPKKETHAKESKTANLF